ncbi:hypothetical protein [Saccharibacillus kuerlensis]|uniref:Type IV pilus assembly protein PilO n=1 Tax=Saccharibacillus kuerlensis TaxID=459527 RepID=A0ABQ2KUB3_9BACL|nr:hypothetical protein [Saccharibacillus kuerlensis]GGN93049.1 hypothetical protein GCM10010969_06170 [Saccharibacillus kuerlensis]
MMERIHNNRQALVLGIAVLFLLLLIPYVLIIRPQAEEKVSNDSEIAFLQQTNDLFQRKIDELSDQEVGGLSSEQIAQRLPEGPDQEQVVTDLYNVGLSTNVRLVDASFANEKSADGTVSPETNVGTPEQIKSVYVTAKIQGSYEGIKSWMKEIQDLPRLTAIEQFTLNKPYVYKGSLLSATVTFSASYLPGAITSAKITPGMDAADTGTDDSGQ